MQQQIFLNRSENAPEFMSPLLGLYPNAVLKGVVVGNDPGHFLKIQFQFFAHNPLRRIPHLDTMFVFDRENIPEVMNEAKTAYIDVGWPNESHARDNYIDLDDNGVYLTNDYAKAWFTYQSRVVTPNGLGETNNINWKWMTDEEIQNLVYHEED